MCLEWAPGIQEQGGVTMSGTKKDPTTSPQPSADKPSSDQAAISEQLEKDADEMAGRATEREKRYDEDHDIFTK
jgi:hypothetical protein